MYQVAFLCVKKNKPHTIAEKLVKLCVMEMTKTVLETEADKKLNLVALSNNVIHSGICDISKDILQQVIANIKVSLQLDEATDISFYSQLLSFVWYVKDEEVGEEFLFCEPLTTITKSIDVSILSRISF